jgi:hypothetical protein
VTAHSTGAAGAEGCFPDATGVAALALDAAAQALGGCCTDGGLANHPPEPCPNRLPSVRTFAHGVSWAGASAAWATHSWGSAGVSGPVAALVAAAAGRMPGSPADSAGSMGEGRPFVGSFAGPVVAHSPDASAAAWACIAGHIRGTGGRLLAAVAAAVTECRAHIGCLHMPAEASYGRGGDPWWVTSR